MTKKDDVKVYMGKLEKYFSKDDNRQKILEKIAKEDEFREKHHKWKKEYGWKDPKKGVCRLCNSVVKADQYREYVGEIRIGGPGRSLVTRHRGYYCTNSDCGIMYKTCPPPITTSYDEPEPVKDEDVK